jgi:methyl coenzyme M reductase subunit C-like uncharacterized protein (methanogenesis marker protein 7)
MSNKELKKEIQKNLERMREMRDEMRVQVHLAGMDSKKVWDKLEPQLEAIEHAAKDFSDATHIAVTNAIKALSDLKASVRA